jgi:ribonuclease E
MGSKMLIDAGHNEETRVVVARGTRIDEFDFESASRKPLKGNIYLAKVTRVEPSLQAAFVEYGGNRHGFLAFAEIHPDYYQIPIADRLALIKEQEEEDAAEDAENGDDDDGHSDENGNDAGEPSHENGDEPVAANGSDDASPALPLESEPAPTISADLSEGDSDTEVDPNEVPAEAVASEIENVEEDAETRQVDSVGAEDALEEVPRRQRRPQRRRYKIQEVIKRRQILLVQVVKEERGNKGAALTTYLSLAGRYCVLMPNTARGGGISRKITDGNDRRRLKELARDIEVPQGMGLIVRTAGAQRTRPEIKRDFDYLIRLWESVRTLTLESQAPSLVYEEGSLIKRSIRDLYTKDVDEVVVEGDSAYREAKDFMKMLMPSHAKNVKLYKEPRPLFAAHHIDHQLDALFSPTVTLPSGGYLVINQTEALVSIDINSGKSTREHSIEDTALRTNLEACDEIGRQLRLRDLAGLIVIDFIDMDENRNNRSVERRIREALKNDRARIQIGRISHFGLLEMSRQRLRPGLLEGTFRSCPHCEGRGIIRSVSSCGLGVLRNIEEQLQKRAENLTVKCARDVAFYLLNEKRDSLLNLEQAYGVTVFLVPGGDDLKDTQVQVERAPHRTLPPRRIAAASPVQIDSAFPEEGVEEEVVDEETNSEVVSEEAAGDEQRDDNGDENGQRRDGAGGVVAGAVATGKISRAMNSRLQAILMMLPTRSRQMAMMNGQNHRAWIMRMIQTLRGMLSNHPTRSL